MLWSGRCFHTVVAMGPIQADVSLVRPLACYLIRASLTHERLAEWGLSPEQGWLLPIVGATYLMALSEIGRSRPTELRRLETPMGAPSRIINQLLGGLACEQWQETPMGTARRHSATATANLAANLPMTTHGRPPQEVGGQFLRRTRGHCVTPQQGCPPARNTTSRVGQHNPNPGAPKLVAGDLERPNEHRSR